MRDVHDVLADIRAAREELELAKSREEAARVVYRQANEEADEKSKRLRELESEWLLIAGVEPESPLWWALGAPFAIK